MPPRCLLARAFSALAPLQPRFVAAAAVLVVLSSRAVARASGRTCTKSCTYHSPLFTPFHAVICQNDIHHAASRGLRTFPNRKLFPHQHALCLFPIVTFHTHLSRPCLAAAFLFNSPYHRVVFPPLLVVSPCHRHFRHAAAYPQAKAKHQHQ